MTVHYELDIKVRGRWKKNHLSPIKPKDPKILIDWAKSCPWIAKYRIIKVIREVIKNEVKEDG